LLPFASDQPLVRSQQTSTTPPSSHIYPMFISRRDSMTYLSRPFIFWGVIGTLVALVLGSIVAVMWACPSIRSRVTAIWSHMTIRSWPVEEVDPRESMHLPIQTPPPPSPPPPSSSPIPIPTRKPSRSFDTFEDRRPIRVSDISQLGKLPSQRRGG
jgi:hypothetical protein